jgi:Taurine catabolism dioxygenase TauD, TfdA family
MSSVTSEKASLSRKVEPLNLMGSIDSTGYAHLKSPISYDEFESFSRKLGSIVYRTGLQITEGRKSVVYKHEEIGFHMDNPNVHIIGWYCVRQDESDGSSLLIDTGDIGQYFSQAELRILQTIDVRCPHPLLHDPDSGREAFFLAPLLSWRGSIPQVYFARWLLLDSYDEKQTNVLDKFNEYLRQKQERELIKLRLGEKEALFINNRRLLHGRGQIGRSSSRFIKRVWITDPCDKW